MTHEEALVRAFITPRKQVRYLTKLSSPRTRSKFVSQSLNHLGDLDGRYAQRIDPRTPGTQLCSRGEHVELIYALLRDRGAPARCYVVSYNQRLDGREIDLHEALAAVVGFADGTLISCIPGRLGYYEGEYENDRYLLERP